MQESWNSNFRVTRSFTKTQPYLLVYTQSPHFFFLKQLRSCNKDPVAHEAEYTAFFTRLLVESRFKR